MPNKFQKRVRTRMKKTGESYQAAYQALDKTRLPSIVEFLSPHVRLSPVQQIVLKLLYGLPLDNTETFELRSLDDQATYTELSYLQHLHANGRCNTSEPQVGREPQQFVLMAGRRSGKSLLEHLFLAYETYRALQTPHQSSPVSLVVMGPSQTSIFREEMLEWFRLLKLDAFEQKRTYNNLKYASFHGDVRITHTQNRQALPGPKRHVTVLDEYAFFDEDVLEVVLSTGKLLVCSTPHDADNPLQRLASSTPKEAVVLQIPSWELNPRIPLDFLRRQRTQDPNTFLREFEVPPT